MIPVILLHFFCFTDYFFGDFKLTSYCLMMVDDTQFDSKSFYQNLIFTLSLAYDVVLFVLLIIPLYLQWIIRQLFKKKKCIRGQLALVNFHF